MEIKSCIKRIYSRTQYCRDCQLLHKRESSLVYYHEHKREPDTEIKDICRMVGWDTIVRIGKALYSHQAIENRGDPQHQDILRLTAELEIIAVKHQEMHGVRY